MNNFEFNQSQNSFSKDFNSSVMNLINKTKQLERKQMENENEQKIPEHSKKFNIIVQESFGKVYNDVIEEKVKGNFSNDLNKLNRLNKDSFSFCSSLLKQW